MINMSVLALGCFGMLWDDCVTVVLFSIWTAPTERCQVLEWHNPSGLGVENTKCTCCRINHVDENGAPLICETWFTHRWAKALLGCQITKQQLKTMFQTRKQWGLYDVYMEHANFIVSCQQIPGPLHVNWDHLTQQNHGSSQPQDRKVVQDCIGLWFGSQRGFEESIQTEVVQASKPSHVLASCQFDRSDRFWCGSCEIWPCRIDGAWAFQPQCFGPVWTSFLDV